MNAGTGTRLREKIAVVTGGASGMGEATATLFAAEGATVVVADIDADGAHRVAAEIEARGQQARPVRADVADESQVQSLAGQVIAEFGRVDVLVNCAGIGEFTSTQRMTIEQWERVIAVNLTGAFLTCREFGRAMVAGRSGKIVNFASTAGLFGVPEMAHYTAAKHGVVGLTKALAVEWAWANVQVNCIAPGATLTQMLLSATTPEFRSDRTKRIPLGRFASPSDQAQAALFLASTDSDCLTGCVLPVDGGVAALAPATTDAALQALRDTDEEGR